MDPQTQDTEIQDVEQHLLDLILELVEELGIQQAVRSVSLDAALDRDLGLGSLERVELFIRVETAFSIRIPDRGMAEVNTPRDLLQTLLEAKTSNEKFKVGHRASIGRSVLSPGQATSLDEVLRRFALGEPRRPHIFLQNEEGGEEVITYGKLFETASEVANGLLDRGLKRGETVAIMLPTGKEFFSSFFGVLLAGGIVVPIYPPYKADRIEEYASRQARILKNADIRFLVTFQKVEALGHILRPFIPSLKEVMTVEKLSTSKTTFSFSPNQSWEGALIQYTSGSTSDPKGVLLAHENVLSNIQAIGKAGQISPMDIGVSWLPLYHDMGLIGSWLCCLYYGIPITVLSPFAFLTRPERWLWAIHYHRATLSAAPNFAYELCVRRIEDKDIEGLDLSSWRLAFNGAEAISPDTLSKFTDRFGPYGFRPETFFPVYGLAEASVALTFPPVGRLPRVDSISREGFQTHQRAEPVGLSENTPLKFISCGVPLPGHEIRIVDLQGKELGERQIGSLHFRGPSGMKGYFQSPEATQSVFHEGWWDTGDLAYRADGELFITGRKKDVIIKAGRNIYPQEIEEIASDVPGIRRGCVAAFGVSEQRLGTERIVVVAETRETDREKRETISARVVELVSDNMGIPPDVVLLILPGAIPKTSSGKLRRASCREFYIQGKLLRSPHPVWFQIAKLCLNSLLSWVKNGFGAIGRYGYAAYVGLALCITVPPVWFLIFIFPRKQAASWLSHVWAKGFLKSIGCPLSVKGKEHLGKATPMVLVSNHASYLDAVVLMAILPPGFLFVAKYQLLRAPIIRTVIQRVGHITVDREDLSKSVSDAKKIEDALRAGSSVLIFPEATFTPVTGLRPFKLGAFKVAAETSRPVCPISIHGTRYILWGDQWVPRRGSISVVIGEPIIPRENSWREITRLRDLVKFEIAKHCGENPLNLVGMGPPTS